MSAATAPPVTLRTTLTTGVALLALWALSFGLSFVPLGVLALPLALVIACAKATLVALYFMELAREHLSIKLTLVTAVLLVILLGSLMVADILTRAPG